MRKRVWSDPEALEIPTKNVEDEQRYMAIGLIKQQHWPAVITYRGEAIRIVSVRRSRDDEVALYES